jgi:hypothetical protein
MNPAAPIRSRLPRLRRARYTAEAQGRRVRPRVRSSQPPSPRRPRPGRRPQNRLLSHQRPCRQHQPSCRRSHQLPWRRSHQLPWRRCRQLPRRRRRHQRSCRRHRRRQAGTAVRRPSHRLPDEALHRGRSQTPHQELCWTEPTRQIHLPLFHVKQKTHHSLRRPSAPWRFSTPVARSRCPGHHDDASCAWRTRRAALARRQLR